MKGKTDRGKKTLERLTESIKIDEEVGTVSFFPYCIKNDCVLKCGECSFSEKIIKKLAEYKDAEEQGKLIRVPCKVGDDLFCIVKFREAWVIEKELITEVCTKGVFISGSISPKIDELDFYIPYEEFGKDSFLTREEAEAKLKERQNETD